MIHDLKTFVFKKRGADRGKKIRAIAVNLSEQLGELKLEDYPNKIPQDLKKETFNVYEDTSIRSAIQKRSKTVPKKKKNESMLPTLNKPKKQKSKREMELEANFLDFKTIIEDEEAESSEDETEYANVNFGQLNDLEFRTKMAKDDDLLDMDII